MTARALVEPAARPSRIDSSFALAVAAAVVANLGAAVQARLNAGLGVRIGNGIAGGLLTTGIALAVLAIAVPAHPAGRAALGRLRVGLRGGELRWWQCLGGVCGGLFIASQGLAVPTIGVAVFTVAVVAGSTAGSILVDGLGLSPSGKHAVTAPRIAGAALAVVAVAIAGRGTPASGGFSLLVLLPLVTGIALSWQLAVNGRVRQVAQSAWAATLVNFTMAATALAVAFGVSVALRGFPDGALPSEPWFYGAGFIGMTLIAVSAAVVRRTGVLVLGLASVAGQLAGAVVVDLVAPGAGSAPGVATWLGVALTFAAVLLATLSRRD